MTYYLSKRASGSFDAVLQELRIGLAGQGFGILHEIDVRAIFADKLRIGFRPYVILGACTPGLAHQALEEDDKIGVLLPCNVIIQQFDDGAVDVAAIDPVATMGALNDDRLGHIARQVAERLAAVLDRLP